MPVAHAQAVVQISPATEWSVLTVQTTLIAPEMPEVPSILKEIGRCESHNQQFDKDGSVTRGKVNHDDVGKYQINEYWNGKQAKALGYDIYTELGNTQMALWMYDHQGTTPWNSSKSCWSA